MQVLVCKQEVSGGPSLASLLLACFWRAELFLLIWVFWVSLAPRIVFIAVFSTWKLSLDQTKANNQVVLKNIFRQYEVSAPFFFSPPSSGSFGLFGGPQNWFAGRSLEDVKQVYVSSALLATAIFMDLTLYLSDSALSTASPGKITQNKPGASALSLCAGLSLPSHGHIPLLIQYSLSLPQSCLFLWHLMLVSLSSCFHFVFFVGPRKLKLCVFVDQTSAAS